MVRAIVAGAGKDGGESSTDLQSKGSPGCRLRASGSPLHRSRCWANGRARKSRHPGCEFGRSERHREVLIDFSTPEATLKNTRVAFSIGLSMVIGTTGISGDTLKEITRLSKEPVRNVAEYERRGERYVPDCRGYGRISRPGL
jgi:dihydrodipicolinate reductase